MTFLNITEGILADADVVAQALAHLLHTIQAFQNRHEKGDLLLLAKGFLEISTHKHVEGLVGTAELNVCLKSHRIVSLHQGVEKFVKADGRLIPITVLEIVPLQDSRHRGRGGQTDHILEGQLRQPLTVKTHISFVLIQHLKDLLAVGGGIGPHLLVGESRPALAFPLGSPIFL